ncbi:hypothetical protein NDU88_006887 [Pleurodeles waltl]|uniref:Uncharacterized protein n=1 Tax=Pleurodeles waltl TaxID=8319 RepID=A0AAV7VRY8_PLEWA|nr:hypothetical protein NDU88_006887 [Pleurodeles waltl]
MPESLLPREYGKNEKLKTRLADLKELYILRQAFPFDEAIIASLTSRSEIGVTSLSRDASSITDPGALIGRLWQPRDQLRVKSGASEIPRREVSGSEGIRVTKEEREDEEPGIEEEDGRKTESTGAEVPRRKPGDSWPGESAPTPPRFRRSVASPDTEKKEKREYRKYDTKKIERTQEEIYD